MRQSEDCVGIIVATSVLRWYLSYAIPPMMIASAAWGDLLRERHRAKAKDWVAVVGYVTATL